MEEFGISEGEISKGIKILKNLDISEYQQYDPRKSKRSCISLRRERRLFCKKSKSRDRNGGATRVKSYQRSNNRSHCSEANIKPQGQGCIIQNYKQFEDAKNDTNAFAKFYENNRSTKEIHKKFDCKRNPRKLSNWKKIRSRRKNKSICENTYSRYENSW